MSLDPRNRFLLLEEAPAPTEKDTPAILLPEDYNVKKNGWAFCQTHIGWYYIVEVDLYDEKLVEYPTRITQEEIDNIQKLAPFTQKWTEFGTNDENGKRIWFDKADLPAKAYKNNTYQAKRYKQKASVLKALEVK